MSADSLLRIAALCVVLACAETLHGIARTVLVIPRIGKDRAIKLSALTGSVLAFVICYLLVPPIGLQGVLQNLVLGLVLAAFMASFDIGLGVFVLKKPWSKIAPDFDPRTGNYLVFGLAFLVMVPNLVAVLRSSP
jgi:predicted transporter